MSWAAVERYAQRYVSPRWLQAWRVRNARSSLPAAPASAAHHPRRLYVDVSVISKHDAGTGIQRFVRAVASQMLADPPAGWQVVMVGATRKRAYHPVSWPDRLAPPGKDAIEARPGDVFLGLDFALDTVRFHQDQLAAFKRQGGRLWFVMYDLLPAQRPDWFSDKMVVRYRKWLGVLAALADGFCCISSPVEDELRRELVRSYALDHGFRSLVLPMGWDLAGSQPSTGIPAQFDVLLRQLAGQPTALMVGTLEPRKGHADVLAAFELLWGQGQQVNLVIVGRPGWKTEQLQAALRDHAQAGSRLFWLPDASDEALGALYEACNGVIAASFAEGFGLPVVEALGHGKPVLARALPVFLLHQARGVQYFDVDATPAALAKSVQEWLAATWDLAPVAPAGIVTWADTTRAILAALVAETQSQEATAAGGNGMGR